MPDLRGCLAGVCAGCAGAGVVEPLAVASGAKSRCPRELRQERMAQRRLVVLWKCKGRRPCAGLRACR